MKLANTASTRLGADVAISSNDLSVAPSGLRKPLGAYMEEFEFGFTEKCDGENHIWLWFGKNVLDDSPPPDDFMCKCDCVAWKDRRLKIIPQDKS